MRARILRVTVITLVLVLLAGVGYHVADLMFTAHAERRIARELRRANSLPRDPAVWVATPSRFSRSPLINGLRINVGGLTASDTTISVAAELTDMAPTRSDHLTPLTRLNAAKLVARTTLRPMDLGHLLGVSDLRIAAAVAHRSGAGGPADDVTPTRSGVILSGTVTVDNHQQLMSVSADLRLVAHTPQVVAVGLYSGPDRDPNPALSPAQEQAVLQQFSATLPRLPLPWDVAPDDLYLFGDTLTIEGTVTNARLPVGQFWGPRSDRLPLWGRE